LFHLKFKRHIRATHGEHGGKQTSTGAGGEDQYIEIPLGTVIRDTVTNEVIKEMTEHEEEYIVAQGGLGGKGNSYLKVLPTKLHAMFNLVFLVKN